MNNTAEVRVGRLLEIRVGAGYRSVADVDAMFEQIGRAMAGRPHRFVVVADLRTCPVMSSVAAARVVELMTRNNPRGERSTALVSTSSPTAALQLIRLIRESQNENRLTFEDADELIAWVRPSLEPMELSRIREFLREGDSASDVSRKLGARPWRT